MLYLGVTIAYAESIDTVPQNFLEVRPTVMVSVPRLYEKMYSRIMQTATSGGLIKKYIFFWALKTGKKYVHAKLAGRLTDGLRKRYRIANKLVFSKLQARTGGRLRFFVSGGAPLMIDIAEFFYAAGLPVLEGYGLTETSPVISANTFKAFKFGTVGKPLPGVDVRLGEDGEILVKGPNVMQGYFNNPASTDEMIVDGWLHTGDIGSIDADGFITITDRKKDIIVTAGGKNIAPQPIETTLKSSKYIAQAVLIGNERKFISAIIVPNFENLLRFAKAARIPFTDLQSLIASPTVKAKIGREIERKSEGLAGYEQIKRFMLLEKDFSLETDELTPTLKVKRAIIENKFKSQIDALYEKEGQTDLPSNEKH
jgi:long-chain acyl-CoA synthetase